MSKIATECTVCGRAAKREPLKAGFALCKLHYQMQRKQHEATTPNTQPHTHQSQP